MPLVTLSIKADLDGLTKLQPKDMDYAWALRVRCANCNEEHDSLVYIQNGVRVFLSVMCAHCAFG